MSIDQEPRRYGDQSPSDVIQVIPLNEKDTTVLGLDNDGFDGEGTLTKTGVDGESTETVTPPEQDPWDIVIGKDAGPTWAELSWPWRIWRILWVFIRLCLVLGFLYLFVCSLDILQDAFQLLAGRQAGSLFTNSFITNPVCGLMIGVLVTVLVQSSSTSTSIVVALVGSGVLEVRPAIPIVMGANIGTTVTNTIVALMQSMDRDVFRRAFAGATVHDAFNWLTVLILLPIEVATGYLYYMTKAMVGGITANPDNENPQFLKVITEPLTKSIMMVDKSVITAIAENTWKQKYPLPKYYCKEVTAKYYVEGANQTVYEAVYARMFTKDIVFNANTSELNYTEVLHDNSTKCEYWFVGTGLPGALTEKAAGAILLVGSLLALIACLILMVKTLNSLLRGSMASIVRRVINADFPRPFGFLTGYVALLVGAGITVLVQSSSVFTSALTPLVGIGIVTVERVYPLTLGSNIGTTVTSMLAALVASATMIALTMQISLCHLFFNITGIIIFYPIPFMRNIPIGIAKGLGNITAVYRWFAVVYLIMMFLLVPLFVVGLSFASRWALVGVGSPLLALLLIVVVINIIQNKRPHWLPQKLQNWDWLPLPLHSLEPYDRLVTSCTASCCACCGGKKKNSCCCCQTNKVAESEASSQAIDLSPSPSSQGSQDDVKKTEMITT